VDYGARRAALRSVKSLHASEGAAACARHLLETLPDGRIKLYVTWKTLSFRRKYEGLFRDGNYLPLKTGGQRAEHLCAFARNEGNVTLLVIVPRLLAALLGEQAEAGGFPVGEAVWGNTWVELPPVPADRQHAPWLNVLTDETFTAQPLGKGERQALDVARLFHAFPFALLLPLPHSSAR
jgi:(1->4)-alpha-D-glucan 1-alpha-D-glucosylmutase